MASNVRDVIYPCGEPSRPEVDAEDVDPSLPLRLSLIGLETSFRLFKAKPPCCIPEPTALWLFIF